MTSSIGWDASSTLHFGSKSPAPAECPAAPPAQA